jgi:hypothetical protein
MEVLYNILIDFRVSIKLVTLIKMRLNEPDTKARVGKYLSDMFRSHKYVKEGDALPPLLFSISLEYAIS